MTELRASMGMVDLNLPDDPALLEAAGRIALSHGQLELMLRMTIKTLTEMSVDETLNATGNSKNWELRKDIISLFNKKTKDPVLRYKLKAIIGKCKQLSKERNRLLHNAWAIAPDGSVVVKGDKHAWGPAAKLEDLQSLTSEISAEVAVLNSERLSGFIQKVCQDSQGSSAAIDS